jgi:mercuric ion transport protein
VKIEILTFEGCPHREATVERTLEVLSALGAEAEVSEVEVRDGADTARPRFPGSPTVRVDGADIEPGAETRSSDALSCRMYGGAGVPPRELLVDAIARAAGGPGEWRRRWLPAAGVPAAGLAALPACPACYPLYAGILSSLGLTLDPGAHLGLSGVLLGLALAALAFQGRARRGLVPLALGAGAALVVAAAKLLVGSDLLASAGAAALVAAGVWNAWPLGRLAPPCNACVPGEAAR